MRISRTRLPIALTVFLAATLFSLQGSAQDKRSVAEVKKEASGNYAYTFGDDPMDGNTLGAFTPRIRVLPSGMRRTLIRPRLNFIPELLKSVENI